ncbi:sensor histidine kinase [Algoriphagus vanfongensis]|uniref:sensor histidine kinase n=1 Tax=Algoriphagus vanfongensis TaxID=426371 RepID=UPI00041935FD|nr:HAMP domain-containing sensor histidine kinase [Algoriphagus vanfongensis]
MAQFFQEKSLVSQELLQERVSRIFALLSGVLLIFLGLSDVAMGLSWMIAGFKFGYSGLYFLSYWWMKRSRRYQLILSLIVFLTLGLITLNFYYNDGFNGPTVYTVFMLVAAIAVLFRGVLKIAWLVFVLLYMCTMIYMDTSGMIQIPSNYSSDEVLFWDHVITLIWCCLFIFLGIQFWIFGYRRQNTFLTQVMEENEAANKELSALNEKKNQLIALLSHDLKNPIATLNSTVELHSLGMMEKEDLQTVFQELKQQSYHLNNVLNNTLHWVMNELDHGKVDFQLIDPVEINEEMVRTMQVQAGQKGQQIISRFNERGTKVDLEVNEVKIILKNLLDNAIKFSPEGSQISVDFVRSEEWICWEVINDGPEIPDDFAARIFEFKIKASYGTNREKGTGIGLPLCKKIADKLGMKLGFRTGGAGKIIFFLEKKLA